MKTFNYLKSLFLFAFLLSFSACTIENGPGPAGPAGPPGPAGNANVVSTEQIVLNTWIYNNQQNWYAANINVPEITADVLNTGLVMVYQQLNGGANPVWIPLPDTYGNLTTNYDFYRGGLTVYRFNVDNTIPIAPTGMVIRIVVIPDSYRRSNPETNWQNYQETKAALNLND
jgi:hypothetical protein